MDFYLFGPEKFGCIGDLASKVEKITTKDPKAWEKEVQLVRHRYSDCRWGISYRTYTGLPQVRRDAHPVPRFSTHA